MANKKSPNSSLLPSGGILDSISKAFLASIDLRENIERTLNILAKHMGLRRGTITLIDPLTGEIKIQVAHGLTDEEKGRGRYRIGEGITGRVIETGKPAVLANARNHPDFLNRTGSRIESEDFAFVCIPLKIENEIFGAISVDRPTGNEASLQEDAKVLEFVSLFISQEIKLLKHFDDQNLALRSENEKLKEELTRKYNITNMIGTSAQMHHLYEQISQVAKSNATVLIRGESGTGKELVANAIHYNSDRSDHPFIRINCGAIPESLIESELFGYEKGAFTDASGTKIGKFELANNGTIFLDEIGDLPLKLQVKLLRILQEKEFERVGGNTTIKINVRIITATNRDLENEVSEKHFREDLYYRLNVFPIFLPPLRDRKSDIMLLADYFLEKFSKENGKKIKRISSLAIDLLSSYHWPGNVRELENCIERAVLICKTDTIQANHLPPSLQRIDTSEAPAESLSLDDLISNYERELIIDALKKVRGNKSKAAKNLQTTERILGYKIEKLNIDFKRFKSGS